MLHNPEGGAAKLTAVAEDLVGKELFRQPLAIPAGAADDATYDIVFQPPAPGDYRLAFYHDGRKIRTFEITALTPGSVTDSMPVSVSGEVEMKLLEEIDCAKDYPDGRYVDDGKVRVVQSPLGSYREAFGEARNSGFAYRLEVANPGRPHWLEIEFPDDKPRAFYTVVEQKQGYVGYGADAHSPNGSLNTIGVVSGINNPVTGKLQTKRLLFWPDSKQLMVGCFLFRPLGGQAGPALRRIRLYENDGPLPRLVVNPPANLPGRSVGQWNEDPRMPSKIWFKRYDTTIGPSFTFWREKLERQIKYLRFTGQNSVVFQVSAYDGDNNGAVGLFPTDVNDGDLPGWACLAATLCEREGMPFHVQINDRVHWAEFGQQGLAMLVGWDKVSKNIVEAAGKGVDAVEAFTADGALADGFNFLHPAVKDAHLRQFRFYRDQFGRYPQFQGILYWTAHYLTFRDGRTGYEDYTISVFERETGVKIPISASHPRRFGERYAWLKANAWDVWLDWRCAKVKEFLLELAAELNPGGGTARKLVLPLRVAPEDCNLDKYPAPVDLSGRFREMGVDLSALAHEPRLVIEPQMDPNLGLLFGVGWRFNQNLDSFWYTDSFASLFRGDGLPALMVSRRANMEVYGYDSPIKSYWWPMGAWGNNGNIAAFSTALPIDKYLPQTMAWSLANCDPSRIEHGWWGTPENGAAGRFQKFYQAYRAIPAVRFALAPGVNDPVAVRQFNAPDGKSGWFYMVNQQCYPVKARVVLDTKATALTDAVFNRPEPLAGKTFEKLLEPYQVACYRADVPLAVTKVEQEVPAEIVAGLVQEVERLRTGARLSPSPQAELLLGTAGKLLEGKRYSALYYLTRSFSARRLLEIADHALDFKASLAPTGHSLDVMVRNQQTREATGSLRLASCPKPFRRRAAGELRFDLKPGENLNLSFPLEGPEVQALQPRLELPFLLEAKTGGEPRRLEFIFRPVVAQKAAEPVAVDADLSDWRGANWRDLDSRNDFVVEEKDVRTMAGFTPYGARFACAWNPKGLYLAAEVKDKELVPGPADQPMWSNDSLEILLDLADDARPGLRECDGNDCVFYLGVKNGKPRLEFSRLAKGQTSGMAASCPVAVKREGDKTVYEAFIPASCLPGVKFMPGSSVGFAFKLNNRDGTTPGQSLRSVLSSSAGTPCERPDRWGDLLFSTLPFTTIPDTNNKGH